MLAYHVSTYVPGSHPICIITIFAVHLPKERAFPINKCMTVVLRNTSPHSTIIVWPTSVMSKSQTANQRLRRALQKVRQLVRLSRPYEKPRASCLRRAKTRFAREQGKHVLSDKLPTIPGVCEANCEDPRRAEPQKSRPPQYKNMQRKRAPSNRLPPIPEDCEVRFEETLKAAPRNTEHQKVKIQKAKPQQHCHVRCGLKQEKRTSTFITPSMILESLVAIWNNHGGSVVVMVLLGALATSLVC